MWERCGMGGALIHCSPLSCAVTPQSCIQMFPLPLYLRHLAVALTRRTVNLRGGHTRFCFPQRAVGDYVL